MPKRIVPLGPKERMRVASAKRKVMVLRQTSNHVAERIYFKTKKIPNMKLVEGLPKTRAGIESRLRFLEKYKSRAKKKEGYHKYGPKFVEIYDLIAEKVGVNFDKPITPQKRRQVYFPSPKIKTLILSLKKKIKADVELDKKTKTNALYTLDSLSKQSQIGRLIDAIMADRKLLLRFIGSEPMVDSSQTQKMMGVFEKTLGRMKSAEELSPVQLANLYIELYEK